MAGLALANFAATRKSERLLVLDSTAAQAQLERLQQQLLARRVAAGAELPRSRRNKERR